MNYKNLEVFLSYFFDYLSSFYSFCFYIFSSYCWMKIYENLKEPNAWFAFIPFLNMWIHLKAGDRLKFKGVNRSFFWWLTILLIVYFIFILFITSLSIINSGIIISLITILFISLVILFILWYFYISAYINILKKLGKNPWLILVTIIPLVQIWVMYHFAFSKNVGKVSKKTNSQKRIDKNKGEGKVKKTKQ